MLQESTILGTCQNVPISAGFGLAGQHFSGGVSSASESARGARWVASRNIRASRYCGVRTFRFG
eukprot:1447313-Prymnesium_polylepis.1